MLDQVLGELLETVELDASVLIEGRDDRGEDASEHRPIVDGLAAAGQARLRIAARRRAAGSEQPLEPDREPGRELAEFARARARRRGRGRARELVSWRSVSVSPGPPKITSWWASRPGSRTEWIGTSPRIAPRSRAPCPRARQLRVRGGTR